MKKKLIGILVCMLVILVAEPTIVSADNFGSRINNNIAMSKFKEISNSIQAFKGIHNEKIIGNYNEIKPENKTQFDILDQYMDHTNGYGWYVAPWQWIAQGFKPTLDNLTRVDLYYFKYGNPPSGIQIIVSIRDDLYGNDIVSTTVSTDQITNQGTWINVDIPDISVVPEKDYYIVCKTTGGDYYNVYCWYCDFNNPYARGNAWGTVDEGYFWWLMDNPPDQPQTDCCFKTYGLGAQEFKITYISGRISNTITYQGYKTFKAVNIRCIQFLPYKYQKLNSSELVFVSDKYLGLLTQNFIFGLFKSSI